MRNYNILCFAYTGTTLLPGMGFGALLTVTPCPRVPARSLIRVLRCLMGTYLNPPPPPDTLHAVRPRRHSLPRRRWGTSLRRRMPIHGAALQYLGGCALWINSESGALRHVHLAIPVMFDCESAPRRVLGNWRNNAYRNGRCQRPRCSLARPDSDGLHIYLLRTLPFA